MVNLKKFSPYIIALVTFIALSAAYFAPQYSGKDIRQGDDIQATGVTGGITQHIEKYGEHPRWAPNLFSGMPAYTINMDYEGRYIKDVSEILYFMGRPAAYYFILMAGFFFMLLCFGVSPYLAIIGSIAYAFSSYFIIIYEAGHITKLIALCYVAPLIGAIYYSYRKNIWLGSALAGIFASLEIAASHPQITYYFLFVIAGLIIAMGVSAYKDGIVAQFWKKSAVLFVAAMLAIGANGMQLWYLQDYSGDSTRSKSNLTSITDQNSHNHTSGLDKDYITAWSYGKAETFNLFIPNLMGGTSSGGFTNDKNVAKTLKKYGTTTAKVSLPAYWGPQPFTSGPVYIGAVIIFLAVFSLFILKGGLKWWLTAVSLLAIFLAWGKNMMWFTDLFIDYFPLYNKFRTVSMILVIVQFAAPLLGILALQKIWEKEVDKTLFYKSLTYSVAICGGVALFFAFIGSSLFDFASSSDTGMKLPADLLMAMKLDRKYLLQADSYRSLLFVLATALSLLLLFWGKIQKGWFIAILAFLVIFDLGDVNLRYLNYADFTPIAKAKSIPMTNADKQILQDTDPNYRVANFSVSTFNDATTSYYHKSVGGYHAAKMRRYQDIIDRHLSQNNMQVFNMLNTKYFIITMREGAPVARLNPDAYGNGWFIDSIHYVASADNEIMALDSLDLKRVAVVDKSFAKDIKGIVPKVDSTSSVKLTNYKVNHLTYKTSSKDDGVVVFSEVYYPKGWKAYIDGVEAPYFRANYILRAIAVPKGEHTVEFKFEAPNYTILKAITAGCSLLLLLGFVVGLYLNYKKR